MIRLLRIFGILLLASVLLAGGALAIGIVLSGENPAEFVRTTIIRIRLSGQQELLEAPAGTDPTPQIFTIEPGDPPPRVAQNLANLSLISDADLFVDYTRISGLDRELASGTYFLRQTQSIVQIAQTLTDTSNSAILFSLFAGMRIEEVANSVEAMPRFTFSSSDFLNLIGPGANPDPEFASAVGLPTGSSLEGFMYPTTYALPPDITATELRDAILTRFQREVMTDSLMAAAAAQGRSLFEIVTLASIVEREAIWDEENAMIASVYSNRLDIGQALEADPTIQYSLNGARNEWWPQITIADYRSVVSPYNTYINAGLPPGPIASPSLASIQATVSPAQSDYFFFRAACDGSGYHVFARTFDEHLANGC